MTPTQTAAPRKTGVAAGRDVLIALAIKVSLLIVIYYCFFAEGHRPKADPETTAVALLDHSAVNP